MFSEKKWVTWRLCCLKRKVKNTQKCWNWKKSNKIRPRKEAGRREGASPHTLVSGAQAAAPTVPSPRPRVQILMAVPPARFEPSGPCHLSRPSPAAMSWGSAPAGTPLPLPPARSWPSRHGRPRRPPAAVRSGSRLSSLSPGLRSSERASGFSASGARSFPGGRAVASWLTPPSGPRARNPLECPPRRRESFGKSARVGVARRCVLSSVGITGTQSNWPRGSGVLAWSCQVGPFSLGGRALPWAPRCPAVATLLRGTHCALPDPALARGLPFHSCEGSLTPYVE